MARATRSANIIALPGAPTAPEFSTPDAGIGAGILSVLGTGVGSPPWSGAGVATIFIGAFVTVAPVTETPVAAAMSSDTAVSGTSANEATTVLTATGLVVGTLMM